MGLTNNLGKLSNMITSTGSAVGIAQPSPSYTLDVSGTGRFTGTIKYTGISQILDASSGTTGYLYQYLANTTGSAYFGLERSTGGGLFTGSSAYATVLGSATATSLQFGTNGIVRMTITSAGNVLIGNATNSILALTTFSKTLTSGFATANNYLQLGAGENGVGGTRLIGFGYSITANSNQPAYIGYIETANTGETKGSLIFGTRDVTTDTAPTERMRITSGGIVQINSSMQTTATGKTVEYSNDGYGGYAYIYGAYGYRFYTNGVERLTISSSGAVTVNGSLSKGSGSFRIKHPLESLSETHQLVHSFIEGPQADLIYRGKLTLVNGKAEANIDLVSIMTEGTFEALCREVQCFTTNESGWDLVKGKVIGNIIYIESQNQNSTDEISWMVIGERKDKHMMDTDWTDDNGKVIVEPLKPIEPITN